MDAAQIAAMIADREAGTPGPWRVKVNSRDDQVTCDLTICGDIFQMADLNGPQYAHQHPNARRMARVPDMEAAIIAQAAELERLREAMGNNCNALTDADCAYLIAHLSYELEPVGKPPTWNQLAMEVIRLSNALALKGGAA